MAVEHPSSADQNDLNAMIKVLPPGFFSSGSNTIQFYRVSYSVGSGGSATMFQDPTPLTINNSTTVLTAAALQAAGETNPPFQIMISGVNIPWTEVLVAIDVNGQGMSGGFLIPSFDADPELYQVDHPQYPQLLALHPFYNQRNVTEDFVSLSQQFCF